MKVFIVLAAVLAAALAQTYEESPKPYSYSYVAEGDEGSSSHSETADGSGVVRGTYSLTDIDGRNRIVEYVAGPEGYNAIIRTNEPGTENANPADVTIESTAGTASANAQLLSAQTRPAQARPAPQARPVVTSTVTTTTNAVAAQGGSGASRFVLVPADDPRARAYYGQS